MQNTNPQVDPNNPQPTPTNPNPAPARPLTPPETPQREVPPGIPSPLPEPGPGPELRKYRSMRPWQTEADFFPARRMPSR
jgi:hypothetical protein